MPLITISCAWVTGIFLGSYFNLPLAFILTGLIPLTLLFLVRNHRKPVIISSLCLIAMFTAATYSYSSQHEFNETSLRFHNDCGTIEIKGKVARDPDVRDKSTHLHVSATEIKLKDGWQAVEGAALIFMPRYPEYQYGDVLLIKGDLATPPQLDDFDYQGYLAHQGIYTTISYPEIEIIEKGNGFPPLDLVYSLRAHMSQTIARVLPEPQASLAQAIILGIRGNMPSELKTDFIHSGTTHLLAISGLHLSIIAGIMLSVGIWLFGRRRYLYVWLALGIIWLYALLTGMHPPVVRGAIMASLFLSAEMLGRQRSALTALTFAAAIMAGISPYILGDAAFQLSFLAMTGLVFFSPTLQAWGRKIVQATLGEEGAPVALARLAADCFGATLGALLAVWPVIAYYFGIVSLASPLATFLLLPVLPAIIITGAVTGILGFIALPAAQVTGWLSWLFLSYMTVTAGALAAPPLSSIEVGAIAAPWIWAYYAVLAAIIWVKSRRNINGLIPQATATLRAGISNSADFISRFPVKWVTPPLLVIALLVSATAATMPDDKLHVSFLDVGQGDAIMIHQGTQQVLVDGGPSPQAINLELSDKMPFWDRTIELLVLTHPHHDHLAGLVEVLQRFRVEQVLSADLDSDSPLYAQWQRLITEKKIKYTVARAGQQIYLDHGTVVQVLNPPADPFTATGSDLDNNSVVLRLSMDNISFLLAADIMREAEWELIRQRARLNSTILKVPHHGSATSTSPEFLTVVNPQLAVISAGADNKLGHPSEEVLIRLQEKIGPVNIYRTDKHGTIEFITDGERLRVETAKPVR